MAYSEDEIKELKEKICDIISTTSLGLHRLCRGNKNLPAVSTIMLWLKEDAEFSEQYAYARELQADLLCDEIMAIADESMNDITTFDMDGITVERENHEVINRSKIRIDARKWKAGKLAPKKYGEKIDVTTEGKSINQVQIFKLPDNDRD